MAIGSPQWMYASGEAYELDQSLKFNDDDSAYLSRTPSSAGNRNTWTFSFWFKLGTNDGGNSFLHSADDSLILTTSSGKISFNCADGTTRWPNVLRDPSAWYHILFAFDSTQSTASNRAKLYINGTQITAETTVWPSLNRNTTINNANAPIYIASNATPGGSLLDGYLAEVNFIDGQALTPADFGETGDYGEWKPIEYSGTYGTNGFYLPFKQDYTVEGFSTVTYTGNGSTQYIGGVGFQPDLVWLKNRNYAVEHVLTDAVRGATKRLESNTTDTETTQANDLQSFDTDGFTVGGGQNRTSANGYTYVAWNWDMGGSNATNTNGSITSTVRANTTYGQSIVSYTGNGTSGATVGHGLSSAPEMIIHKNRSAVDDWSTWHTELGTGKKLFLNGTNASSNTSNYPTLPTSSLFYVGAGVEVNGSGNDMIAYCFHSVSGYSKFGSYTGTGSSGNAITTGFKPAFVIIKQTNASGENWGIVDSTRNPTNPINEALFADSSAASSTSSLHNIDFDSNGFTIQNSHTTWNGSGDTYIYMAFADKREYAYWLDQSGNNNDWTSNNLTESDISVDSPTNNFATMNPLDKDSDITLYEGNTRAYSTNSGGYACTSTISTDSGKWYAEINSLVLPASTRVFGGWALNNYDDSYDALDDFIIHNLGSFQRYVALGSNYDNVSTSFAAGDILQLAWDMDAGKFWFGKNGTWINSGNPTNGTNATVTSSSVDSVRVVYRVSAGAGTTGNLVYNFGQDSSFAGNKTAQGNQDSNDIGDFYYTPPTGFLALCTKNLPDATVTPSEHFNTVLYTGNGVDDTSITGVGFQPDLVWAKERSSTSYHLLTDVVRTAGKMLYSNVTDAEYVGNDIKAFDTDGFTVSGSAASNQNSETYVAWNWKANGSGSSNTNGTITSTVSANVDAGFSIVSYTGNFTAGATVGHGLSQAPEMMIIKNRIDSTSWPVYHAFNTSAPATDYLYLNTTAATADNVVLWNDTKPDSSVFTLGNSATSNGSGDAQIAYCFHSVDGYSKVGSYTGNGNADGTFVYTGFRPAFVMIKRSDGTSNWELYDTARNSYNGSDLKLYPNLSAAEGADAGGDGIDHLSNGFKLRSTTGGINVSTGAFIYLCFAETPFKYSNAR